MSESMILELVAGNDGGFQITVPTTGVVLEPIIARRGQFRGRRCAVRRLLVAAGLVAGVCVLSLAYAGGAEQSKETTPESGASDLKAAVADVTKRVAALEKRTQQLEENQHTIMIPQGTMRDQKSIPKDWKRMDFNGWTYYIVPLGEK